MARFAVAAFATNRPWLFLVRQVFRRHEWFLYPTKFGHTQVAVRHGVTVEALYEIFTRRCYEPPQAVEMRLRCLEGPLRVLDIGANVGVFSAYALNRWPSAVVTAIEADPANAREYRKWSEASGASCRTIEAAASTLEGRTRFAAGLGGGSRHAGEDECALEVRTIDVLPHLAASDFVKLDIEGGEWSILADRRLREIGPTVLVMEYHRYLAPQLPARSAAELLLRNAGFTVGYGEGNYWGHGTLWAWNY